MIYILILSTFKFHSSHIECCLSANTEGEKNHLTHIGTECPQREEEITGLGQAISNKNERATEACFIQLSKKPQIIHT